MASPDVGTETTRFETVQPSDPRLVPALEDLVREYDDRYGDLPGHDARSEVYGGPVTQFSEVDRGAFVALFDGDEVIATGAARRYDDDTVELKKLWSHPKRRGQRLASRLLAHLESVARDLGYRRVFLTTGPRQPEADRLYLRSGYTAHHDPEDFTPHAYTKALVDDADGTELPPGTERVGVAFSELVASRGEVSTRDAPEASTDAGRRVLRRRHWGRWIFAALAIFIVAQLAWQLVVNPRWRWDVFAQYVFSQSVVEGLLLTLTLTAISAVIGFLLGGVLAVMRMSASPILSTLASGYIWFFRAVPLVVQLVVWYNLGYLWPTLGLGTPFTNDF